MLTGACACVRGPWSPGLSALCVPGLCDMFLRECGRLAGFRTAGESRLPAEKWDINVGSLSAKQQNEFADRVGIE